MSKRARRLTVIVSLFLCAWQGAPPAGPPTGAYVGYTAPLSPPNFFTCAAGYANALLTPAANTGITAQVQACGNQLSGYHFAVQYNNRNGTVPVPAGHVVVERVRVDYLVIDPCGAAPVRVQLDNIEYFRTLPAGNAAVDNYIDVPCCESEYRLGGLEPHANQVDIAIVPLPAGWPPIPAGENAVVVPFANAAAQTAFINNTLIPNKTLSMWWDYVYDNCPPIVLPGCAVPPNHHDLNFYAETLNPPAAAPTWSTGPTRYCGR